jgi:hypothetical protein
MQIKLSRYDARKEGKTCSLLFLKKKFLQYVVANRSSNSSSVTKCIIISTETVRYEPCSRTFTKLTNYILNAYTVIRMERK